MLHRLNLATRNVLGDLRDGAPFAMVVLGLILAIGISVFVPGVRMALTDAGRMLKSFLG
jgi:hypothetical protein